MRIPAMLSLILLAVAANAQSVSSSGPCGTGRFIEKDTTVTTPYFSILAVKGLLCEVRQDGRAIHFSASPRQSLANFSLIVDKTTMYPDLGAKWKDLKAYFEAQDQVCWRREVQSVPWTECKSTHSSFKGWYESFEAHDLWWSSEDLIAHVSYHYPKRNQEFKEPFEQILNSVTLE